MSAKRIHVRVASDKHRVSSGVYSRRWSAYVAAPDLERSARKFWEDAGLMSCDGSVVATVDGKIVGFVRYYLWPMKMLQESGTWVSPKYRRSGLAARMWSLAIRRFGIKVVKYRAISNGGRKFVARLKLAHKNVTFRSA